MINPGVLVVVDPADPSKDVPFQFRPAGFRDGGQARIEQIERDLAPPATRFAGVDLHTFPLDCLWDSRRRVGRWPGTTLDVLRAQLHHLTIPVGGPDSGLPPPVVRYVPWGTGLDWTVTADWSGADIAHRPADGSIMAIRIRLTLTHHRPLVATRSIVQAPDVVTGPAGTEYVVKPGDYLSKIAAEVYGDGNLWTLIWDANKDDRIGSGDPDVLQPGETLRIPPKPA